MADTAFTHCQLPWHPRPIFRLGLAPNYGLDPDGIRAALEGPIQYIFWTRRMGKATAPLREALKRDRERYIVATGPTTGFFGWNLRSYVEDALRDLDTSYLDLLQLHWLGTTSAWTEGTVEALVQLREQGKVRAIGVSIHDRPRAGQLAKDSPLDALMIRYNAAHPGAERDIFPHLPGPGALRRRAIVAYTATAWRRLLKAPGGWSERVATAGDCYRFCLSQPAVAVTLCGPGDRTQLDQNLRAVEQGPLSDEEMTWLRRFGSAVHG
jgi:aryl-alcohol dehydrogenase-like predicted oxidoreductase